MKVLVLLVVGVLVCSLTGAQTVSKCQLIDKLRAAINSSHHATQKELEEEDLLVARIVCHVEYGSNFSTSIVKELIQNNRVLGRHDRSTHQESSSNEDHSSVMHSEENNHGNSSSPQESDDHHRHRRDSSHQHDNEQGDRNVTDDVENDHGNSSKPQESGDYQQHRNDSSHQHDNEQGVTPGVQKDHGSSEHKHRSRRHVTHHHNYEKDHLQNVTLYGILQLPECTCRNSMNTSSNICGIDCSRLTDGNIDDDISCFFKIFPYNNENHSGVNDRNRPSHFGRHSREEHEDDNSREEHEDELCTLNCPEPKMCKDVKADYIGGCPTA